MGYLFNNPLMQIAALLIAGLTLMIVFSILNRFVASLVEEKRNIVFLQWSRAQIVFWLIYSLFLYSLLYRYYMVITLIVTIVVLGLGWNYWKDIFAGILIKLENKFSVGDFISTDFSRGVLQSVKFAQSALVNDAGELVIIPNNRLRNEVLTYHQDVSDASVYSVEVKTAPGQTIKEIYDFAYNCPYISANKEINIERQNDVFSIRATIIDFSFVEQADAYFRSLPSLDEASEN